MLFLSIGLWGVVVYSLRIGLFGNPLSRHIAGVDPELLRRIDALTNAGELPQTAAEAAFLTRFSRLTLLELGAFVIEIGLLTILWHQGRLVWLCLALLLKNLVLFAVSVMLARGRPRDGLFGSLLTLPEWLVRLDRLSAWASGIGCLILFLAINEIKFG